MYFYHFTTSANIASIRRFGLNIGVTPFSQMTGHKAVSLTTVPNPERLGLLKGETLTEGYDDGFDHMEKCYPQLIVTNSNGLKEIKLFDQTESLLKIDLNIASSKLLNYNDFFEKEIIKGLYPKKSNDLYEIIKAVGIHSADYPYSTKHLPKEVIDSEVEEIVKGRRKHNAGNWYFYFGVIKPANILQIQTRQQNGSYA